MCILRTFEFKICKSNVWGFMALSYKFEINLFGDLGDSNTVGNSLNFFIYFMLTRWLWCLFSKYIRTILPILYIEACCQNLSVIDFYQL